MRTSRLATLAALALLGSCRSGTAPPDHSGIDPARVATTTITVENNNWLDVVVYFAEGATRTSILRVGTNRTAGTLVPPEMIKNGVNLRLLADFVGSVEDHWSARVFLRPGQELRWTLEENLQYSRLSIHSGGL